MMRERAKREQRERGRRREEHANYQQEEAEKNRAERARSRLILHLHELARGQHLVAHSVTVKGGLEAIGHTDLHLLFVIGRFDSDELEKSIRVSLKQIHSVTTIDGGSRLQISYRPSDSKDGPAVPITVDVGDHDMQKLSAVMEGLSRFDSGRGQEHRHQEQQTQGPHNGHSHDRQRTHPEANQDVPPEDSADGPSLVVVADGMSALRDAYIRLSSHDGNQILALTPTHLLQVFLPGARMHEEQSQVFKAPVRYIKNVRSTSTGGLLIELHDDWDPIEMQAENFPYHQLSEFFITLHAAVVASVGLHPPGSPSSQYSGEVQPPAPLEDIPPPPAEDESEELQHESDTKEMEEDNNEVDDLGESAATILTELEAANVMVRTSDGQHIVGIVADDLVSLSVSGGETVVSRRSLQGVSKVVTTQGGNLLVTFHAGEDLELDPNRFEINDLSLLFEALYVAVIAAGGAPNMDGEEPSPGATQEPRQVQNDDQQGGSDTVGSLNWRLHVLESHLDIELDEGDSEEGEETVPEADNRESETCGQGNCKANSEVND